MLARALSRCIQSTDTLPLITVTSSWAITRSVGSPMTCRALSLRIFDFRCERRRRSPWGRRGARDELCGSHCRHQRRRPSCQASVQEDGRTIRAKSRKNAVIAAEHLIDKARASTPPIRWPSKNLLATLSRPPLGPARVPNPDGLLAETRRHAGLPRRARQANGTLEADKRHVDCAYAPSIAGRGRNTPRVAQNITADCGTAGGRTG
jgi:hypothetical protein